MIAIVLAMALASGVGCRRAGVLEPPAQAVESILQLRSGNATDVASYERHVESTALAQYLAQDSAEATSSRIPDWNDLTVISSSETTATVRVTWKVPARGFEQWPDTTDFVLTYVDDAWKIVDTAGVESQEASSSEPSP